MYDLLYLITGLLNVVKCQYKNAVHERKKPVIQLICKEHVHVGDAVV